MTLAHVRTFMTTYTPYAMAAWKPCGAWQRVGSIARSNTERRPLMEHYRPAPGTPLQDLDTPCLLIDLDAVEHNFRLIADTYRDTVCKMRTQSRISKALSWHTCRYTPVAPWVGCVPPRSPRLRSWSREA